MNEYKIIFFLLLILFIYLKLKNIENFNIKVYEAIDINSDFNKYQDWIKSENKLKTFKQGFTQLSDFYSEIINGISSTVLFKENYSYLDYQSDDYISTYTLSNLIDSSYGNENAADQTIMYAFCLPTTEDLKAADIATSDYERFAGKEIKFIISETRNEIADLSDDEAVSVLTGMYGIADKQPYTKTNNNIINYTNEIELEGDNENDKVKYNYKNIFLCHSRDIFSWNKVAPFDLIFLLNYNSFSTKDVINQLSNKGQAFLPNFKQNNNINMIRVNKQNIKLAQNCRFDILNKSDLI